MGVSLGSGLPTRASLGDLKGRLSLLLCDDLRWVGGVACSLVALLEFPSRPGLRAVCLRPRAMSAGGGGRAGHFRPSADTLVSFQGNQQGAGLDPGGRGKVLAWL